MSPTSTNTKPSNDLSALERAQIEIERRKAHEYRSLYSMLLEKHQDVLQKAWSQTDTEESRLIQSMWESERNAIAVGFLVGCATLAAVRLGTPMLVRRIGGEEKWLKSKLRDEEAKRMGTYKYQRAFAWLVEGGFSLWVGSRAHQHQAQKSDSAYNTVANIPLCAGRSIIADGICDEWVDITTKQVPRKFWKNLQIKDAFNDDKTWRAIARFSNNCVKRRAYVRQIDNGSKAPRALPSNVPGDLALSEDEIASLVDDSPP